MFSMSLILLSSAILSSFTFSKGKYCSVNLQNGKLASVANCDSQKQASILGDLDRKLVMRGMKTETSTSTTIDQLFAVSGSGDYSLNDDFRTTAKATTADVTRLQTTGLRGENGTVTQNLATTFFNENGTTTLASGDPTNSGEGSGEYLFNSSDCDVTVNSVCYWIYLNYTNWINFTQAQQICAEKNFVLGYFTTELAYSKTVDALLSKSYRMVQYNYALVYLGIIIDPMTGEVIHPDGEIYKQWHWYYYWYYSSYYELSRVVLDAHWSDHSQIGGMYTYDPSWTTSGVVCQEVLK